MFKYKTTQLRNPATTHILVRWDCDSAFTLIDCLLHFEDLTSGIEIFNSEKICLYPNPVKDILRIVGIENAEISVYTIEGKLVKTSIMQNNELNISELSAGNYLIKIEYGKETITKQIVKE